MEEQGKALIENPILETNKDEVKKEMLEEVKPDLSEVRLEERHDDNSGACQDVPTISNFKTEILDNSMDVHFVDVKHEQLDGDKSLEVNFKQEPIGVMKDELDVNDYDSFYEDSSLDNYIQNEDCYGGGEPSREMRRTPFSSISTDKTSATVTKRRVNCGQTVSNKFSSDKHSVVHTGDRLYKCHICANNFSQKCHLERHLKIHGNRRLQNDNRARATRDNSVHQRHSVHDRNRISSTSSHQDSEPFESNEGSEEDDTDDSEDEDYFRRRRLRALTLFMLAMRRHNVQNNNATSSNENDSDDGVSDESEEDNSDESDDDDWNRRRMRIVLLGMLVALRHRIGRRRALALFLFIMEYFDLY